MDRPTLLSESKTLIDSIPTWKPLKPHTSSSPPITTSLYSTTSKDGEFWCARKSAIPATYKQPLIACILGEPTMGATHSDHEAKYIHEITGVSVSQIEKFDDGWKYDLVADYDFGGLLSKRRFYETQHVFRFEDCAYVMSVPFDGPKEEGYVVGTYRSIERLSWGKDGDVEWTMATTSDPGGFIPQWITRLSIPGAIAKDVPSVLNYIQK
ncbi:hypothetical protein Cantr_06697 [Candida viswanathii]|uniref:DUF3074 domain-containing protein n=1 Tax=Candida viswanathii TaxID=5486 RepID=A0A367XV34_9ASCO|nr:hypothetical protein Cantr_06697 [Candida viswanathii]